MAMRSQVYEWDCEGATASALVGTQTSIFIGGAGNNITKPAETSATQFIVIEDVKSDLRFAIDKSFKEYDVEIPFPQRVIWKGKEQGFNNFNC